MAGGDKQNITFTILLPTRNGGAYLPLCIESILAQAYRDFELVILENQSTDGTAEWLHALEGIDDRIKIIHSECSLSIEDNWKRILTVRKREFMTIVGHDDLLAPDFLEEIVKIIQVAPDASLYLTHYRLIDSNGSLIRYCTPMPGRETAAEFLAARMAEIRDSFGTGYVMRSRLYDEIGGIPEYPNLLFSDDALWMKLMGSAYRATSARVCFSYRLHPGSVSGTPNRAALFAALKLYLAFLSELAIMDVNVARVMKLYGGHYVTKWCLGYYYHLVGEAPWGRRVDGERLGEIKELMHKYASDIDFDWTCSHTRRLRIKCWVSKLIGS